ncbi:MAG TPA: ribosome-binding factor A [Candidatus Azoamicus sp. OHIO2]
MTNINIRIKRINSLIKKKIFYIITNELFSKEFISITSVKTTADLTESHIYFLTSANCEEVANKLNAHVSKIQYKLSKVIKVRKLLKIRFFCDKNAKSAINVLNLMENLKM